MRVDSQGRVVGRLQHGTLHALPTLQLTIDARIQRAADKAVLDGIALARANGHSDAQAGAAVVMNPRTGAIYALASYPTYNQVAAAQDAPYRASLFTDPARGLLNQATQGVYPTGSTFKPIVAEAALSEGIITPSTQQLCTGSYTVGTTIFHNVEAGVYSSMSLPTALAESCDTWFYRLGAQFFLRDSQGMQHWAKLLGLGHPTGLDVPGEVPGLVPTPAWLERTYHEQWYEGQSINLSIGRGLPPGDTPPVRGRLFRARERRHHRPPARRAGDPPGRVGADAEVQAGAEGEARRCMGDQGRALRSSALAERHLGVGLRELPRPGRRQDGHRGIWCSSPKHRPCRTR